MANNLFGGQKITVYTDGGARGNPGPAALGVVVGDKEYSEYLGHATNNHAEYRALIFALKKLKQTLGKDGVKNAEVEIRMDSELVVKQMNGKYKIEQPELQILFLEAWNSKIEFGNLKFVHIPREENKRADRLVNQELDKIRV